jgi:hypothetical protein
VHLKAALGWRCGRRHCNVRTARHHDRARTRHGTRLQGERTVVLINYGTAPARVRVPDLPPGQALRSAHPAGGALAARVGRDGSATLQLAPLSVRVFDVAAAQAPVQAGQRPARSNEGAARPKPRPGQPG